MDWEEIRAWRRNRRAEILSRRMAVSRQERDTIRQRLGELVAGALPAPAPELCVGFYWPIKAEFDFRHLLRELVEQGARAALPVVVEKAAPLEFWNWRPRMKMTRGVWNIPIPELREPVLPDVLIVPLVGFDAAGYRLGYGGGYYDRTLAAFAPRPLTIAVGYEFSRLETIHPQPHDIPMDIVATEAGLTRHGGERP